MTATPALHGMAEWADAVRRSRPGSPPATREVTPSRHDLHQAITTGRTSIAVIAEFAVRSPEEGELPSRVDLTTWLDACDDGEVAALALPTDDRFGGSDLWLRTARAKEIPLLHHRPCLCRDDVVRSRLLGADAVWTHLAFAPDLVEVLTTSKSFHMAALVEVADEAQQQAALDAGARVLCFSAFDDAGAQDLDPALELLEQAPSAITRVIRGPVSSVVTLDALRGKVDAIWLCGPVLVAIAEGSGIAEIVRAAEGT